jgi:hypothetical protein
MLDSFGEFDGLCFEHRYVLVGNVLYASRVVFETGSPGVEFRADLLPGVTCRTGSFCRHCQQWLADSDDIALAYEQTHDGADRGREDFRCAVVDHHSPFHLFFSCVISAEQKQNNSHRNSKEQNASAKLAYGTRQYNLPEPLKLTLLERGRSEQQCAFIGFLRRFALF